MMMEIATLTSSKVPPMIAHASLRVIGLASTLTSLGMEAATPIPVTTARHVDGELRYSLKSCIQFDVECGRYIFHADAGMVFVHDLTCACSCMQYK